jgi:hypothetical protein
METPSDDLIVQLKKLRESIESEGKYFEVFGLDPFVPFKKDTDYILTVKGEWLPVPGSIGLKHLINRYQQLISSESRRHISRIRPQAHYEGPPPTLIPVG